MWDVNSRCNERPHTRRVLHLPSVVMALDGPGGDSATLTSSALVRRTRVEMRKLGEVTGKNRCCGTLEVEGAAWEQAKTCSPKT
eukprot:s278_g25.t1